MAKKIRITVTAVVEYELVPDYYPGCSTYEEMLKTDLANAEDDIILFLDQDGNTKWNISGEVVD